ncbi:MAG: hypothetical protein AAGA30_09175, partial [Planctomycetota bacterium]
MYHNQIQRLFQKSSLYMFVLFFAISPCVCLGQAFFEDQLPNDVCNGISGKFYEPTGDGFSLITGTLGTANGVADDGIDVYKIVITDPLDFYIRMDAGVFPDSKVFLFESSSDGTCPDEFLSAVLQNDDDPYQAITNPTFFGFRDGTNHLGGIVGMPPTSFKSGAVYYLAIGRSGDEAFNSMGENLFEAVPANSTALVGPAIGVTDLKLGSWSSVSTPASTYFVRLTGARMVGYSIPASNLFEFKWTGAVDEFMATDGNWLDQLAPTSTPTTDIFFEELTETNNFADQDLSVIEVRSVEVNCDEVDFTLASASDLPICVYPYGRICVRDGLPSRVFRITSPLLLDSDAFMVADDGEFLIDGTHGNKGTVIGSGSSSFGGLMGAFFRGPNGYLTLNGVGSSDGALPMGNFDTAIEFTVQFQNDNYFAPPVIKTQPNTLRGPIILDSSGGGSIGGSINGGRFSFRDTFVLVTGGEVFTLDSSDQFRFSTSYVVIASGTELYCKNGRVSGGGASMLVSDGATLRLGDIEYRTCLEVEPGGLLTGTGVMADAVICDGIIEPGNSAGTLDVLDDLDLSDTTVTCIELGGVSTDQFDRIGTGESNDLVNQYNLDGTLVVSLIDGFTPSISDEFMIMNAAQINQQFNAIQSNLLFDIEYGTSFVRLFNFQPGIWATQSFDLDRGSLLSGDTESVRFSDGNSMNIQLNRTASVRFDTTLPDPEVQNLGFSIESKINSKNVQQNLSVYNWTLKTYQSLLTSKVPFNEDTVIQVDLTLGIDDFVGPNGELSVRVNVGPTFEYPVIYSIDQVTWNTGGTK